MRLNKHGWGLTQMLLLSSILVLFLIVAIYYIYNLYSSFGPNNSFNYVELEEKLENQALVYINDYYDSNLTSDYITITRNVLRSYDLDINLFDNDGEACSGYVVANKSRGITNVNAYIKCDDYMTKGYEEWRD